MTDRKKITLPVLRNRKKNNKKISWITAYDFATASFAEQAGIDMILVGDSGAMVQHGHETTLPISMASMITMCQSVKRGASNTFIVGDMPFGSYESSDEQAINNAVDFLKNGG